MKNNKHNNSLEDFVQKNREAFDEAIPNLGIWTEIEKGLDQKNVPARPKTRRLWYYSRIAVAALLLIFSGGIIGNFIGQTQSVKNSPTSELAEIEAFYKKRISEKYAQLTNVNHDKSIDDDLAQIDEVMKELKADMLNQVPGAQEKIVNNLIKSYQLKINILERVLEWGDGNDQQQNNERNVQVSL